MANVLENWLALSGQMHRSLDDGWLHCKKKCVEIFYTNMFYLKLHILWVLFYTICVHFVNLKHICVKASYT